MSKKKYYAVARGFKTGIFETWSGKEGAQEQIQGFKNARYKGFSSLNEAEVWLKTGHKQKTYKKPDSSASVDIDPDQMIIYTDGGALNNPGPGGYGAILIHKNLRKEISGGYRKTTNNRMELLACIKSLQLLSKKQIATLHTDSQYIVNGINKGWAKKWKKNNWFRNKLEKAENSDLWSELLELTERHTITFVWVKGHSGILENENCDALVREQSAKSNLPPDINYENKTTRKPVFQF